MSWSPGSGPTSGDGQYFSTVSGTADGLGGNDQFNVSDAAFSIAGGRATTR